VDSGTASAPPAWRTVEAAAFIGIGHAALAGAATWLFWRAPDVGEPGAVAWYGQTNNQRSIILAVNLMTLSSIAFVWFVAVIRRRVGDRENRFFGTVFFGSALVLAGSWLVGAVFFAVPAVSANLYGRVPDLSDIASFTAAGVATTSVVATRLEAVFILSTTTVVRMSGAFPQWVTVFGYSVGGVLMLVPLPNRVVTVVFPCWVVVVCIALLIRRREIAEFAEPGHVSDPPASPA
jgi:hypothetical protein